MGTGKSRPTRKRGYVRARFAGPKACRSTRLGALASSRCLEPGYTDSVGSDGTADTPMNHDQMLRLTEKRHGRALTGRITARELAVRGQ